MEDNSDSVTCIRLKCRDYRAQAPNQIGAAQSPLACDGVQKQQGQTRHPNTRGKHVETDLKKL